MYSKTQIFNLALGALLLNKRISDPDTDTSIENSTLNVHYDAALSSTLSDLDLDGTSDQVTLELLEEEPNDLWLYAYRYPSDCKFLRRLQSGTVKDTRSTQIKRRIGMHEGTKAIFTNQPDAIAEYISDDISLDALSAPAGLALAYRLAMLASPLIAGKGANKLREEIAKLYIVMKAEAQEHDRLENATFDDDATMSEFVEERTS